jgi:hypothetical protein|tara:strand:- start:800 stop:1033 length:234 start_codon:yes stop_codon:yes gene_type:complete
MRSYPTTPSQAELEKIYGPLHKGAVEPMRNKYWAMMAREGDREQRRLKGVRRRAKITGQKVDYFSQGLGAHRRPKKR